MRWILLLSLLIPFAAYAEYPTTYPTPVTATATTTVPVTPITPPGGCTNEYEIYRCGCRVDLTLVSGGVSSEPLLINGQIVIYSQSDLSGTACRGNFRPDACRSALNGAEAVGRYACALVRVRGADVTVR